MFTYNGVMLGYFFMKSKFFLQVITVVLNLFAFCIQANSAPVAKNEAVQWANSAGEQLIKALGSHNLKNKYIVLDKMFADDVDGDILLLIQNFILHLYIPLLRFVRDSYCRLPNIVGVFSGLSVRMVENRIQKGV